MNTLTKFFNLDNAQSSSPNKYEVIENETLKGSNFKNLSVSGSLFSLTTFKCVTFESCVFFATKMENCLFIDCEFIDCKFQFSNIEHCSFQSSSFVNCNWDLSPVRKSTFFNCDLNAKTEFFLNKESNSLTRCYCNESLKWIEEKNEVEVVTHYKNKKAA